MAANDEKAYIVEALAENMADDPYGTAVYVIRRALEDALEGQGSMNDTELANIEAIARRLIEVDPASAEPLQITRPA